MIDVTELKRSSKLLIYDSRHYIENPADSEINTIWTFGRPIDSLVFVPAAYGGLLCLKPSALWLFGKMLSPAALSVMRAMPHLFEDR